MKKFLALLGIAALVIGAFVMEHTLHVNEPAKEAMPLTPISTNLDVRGRQLRVALDQKYKKMSAAHALKMQPKEDENDMTTVVLKYIPLGTSFDDAEQILRSAGFEVLPRPDLNPIRYTDKKMDAMRFDVIARIVLDVNLSSLNTTLVVLLEPQSPRNYTKVSKIYAHASITGL